MKRTHSLRSLGAAIATAIAVVGCSGPSPEQIGATQEAQQVVTGIPLTIPAFYDDELFTIHFVELPPKSEEVNLTNPSLNNIYQSDACPGFTSVIDAIPGDGMNPLWQEVQITPLTISCADLIAGQSMDEFTSDDAILAAAAAGEISLTNTGEVYRCPVIGQKPIH